MSEDEITRRRFVRLTVLGAAAPTLGLNGCVSSHGEVNASERGGTVPSASAVSPTPAPSLLPEDLDDFLALSELLTGFPELPRDLGARYFSRMASEPFGSKSDEVGGPTESERKLRALLRIYRDTVKGLPLDAAEKAAEDWIMEVDSTARPAAEQLIYLWYVGAFGLLAATETKDAGKIGWKYRQVPAPDDFSDNDYEQGLIWKAIGVPPPMTGNVGFGVWGDAPKR